MKKNNRHYKFINGQTGYAIHYCSFADDLDDKQIKEELEKIKAQVAIKNGIYLETVYWEEEKDQN